MCQMEFNLHAIQDLYRFLGPIKIECANQIEPKNNDYMNTPLWSRLRAIDNNI